MRWQGRRQSSNIEDRRGDTGDIGGFGGAGPRIGFGMPGGRRGGGLSIGAVVVVLLVSWLLGVNPLTLLGSLEGTDSGGNTFSTQQTGRLGTPSDQAGQFVATVLADTDDTWTAIFAKAGTRYQPPTLVLFTGRTASACGLASAASGPFYCPGDHKVYIDLAFYQELRDRFHAPGDFAQAYVIAHEVGHHVQNLTGILPKVTSEQRAAGRTQGNALQVRTELQADCYAGVWAHAAEQERILDVGDIDEALNAAAQIGDDTLQKETQGTVVPDSFTHGTSAQRSRWFKRGYAAGAIDSCDTFSASSI
jgi:predicted metalloprotease